MSRLVETEVESIAPLVATLAGIERECSDRRARCLVLRLSTSLAARRPRREARSAREIPPEPRWLLARADRPRRPDTTQIRAWRAPRECGASRRWRDAFPRTGDHIAAWRIDSPSGRGEPRPPLRRSNGALHSMVAIVTRAGTGVKHQQHREPTGPAPAGFATGGRFTPLLSGDRRCSVYAAFTMADPGGVVAGMRSRSRALSGAGSDPA
jgi:hypothetical protein